MLIAPNTKRDKLRRYFNANFSFHGFSKQIGFWGSICSIAGFSCFSIYKNTFSPVVLALLTLSFIALYYQYKYYHYIEKVSLANSLHEFRHQIAEEIRSLDEYINNLMSMDPNTVNKDDIDKNTSTQFDKICDILKNAFSKYGINTSGVFIKALNQNNMQLITVAKKCSRESVDKEILKNNLFVKMLITCLTNNEKLISDFNQKKDTSLPKVPINQNPGIPCLALCDFESDNFPSSFNEILNEHDAKLNNTHKNQQQAADLKKRINGKYKSCLGFTISNRGQKSDPSQKGKKSVSVIPVAGFIGIDSQNPYDFEKVDKPLMEFLAGIADSLYTTIHKKTVVEAYVQKKSA